VGLPGQRPFQCPVDEFDFDHLGGEPIELEQTRVVESQDVTHLRYRVVRG
jgi:hypothetical protein